MWQIYFSYIKYTINNYTEHFDDEEYIGKLSYLIELIEGITYKGSQLTFASSFEDVMNKITNTPRFVTWIKVQIRSASITMESNDTCYVSHIYIEESTCAFTDLKLNVKDRSMRCKRVCLKTHTGAGTRE